MCSPRAGSAIIKLDTDWELACGWVEEMLKAKISCNLLYRASRDGFDPKDFHSRCDRVGPTLVVIRSAAEKICGGFTSVPWESREEEKCVNDPTAFIFSLSLRTKCVEQLNENSVCHNANKGPIFGLEELYGNDLAMDPQGSVFSGNHTYKLPENADETVFLAGSGNYKVNDFEVFSVKLNQ